MDGPTAPGHPAAAALSPSAAVPAADLPTTPDSGGVVIRPFSDADRPFLREVVWRLRPETSVARREPAAFDAWFRRLAEGEHPPVPGAETFVAVGTDGAPLGVLTVQPDREYFTGTERTSIEAIAVAAGAEGRGVGRALLAHAEAWARAHGHREVALDVFAANARARAFYARAGFEDDHVRMVKPIDGEQ